MTHIPDEAVQAAHAEYHKVLGDKNRSNPMLAALHAATPYLSAPCAVEVKPSSLVNAANILASDTPHIVVQKLDTVYSQIVTKPIDVIELSGISRQLQSVDAVTELDDSLIKELEDAIAWRKLPNQENHKSTLRILERALSAILSSRGAHRAATELDLSNLIRHAFISGFEAMGGTITDAINNWPVYDYERCPSYGVIARALSSAEPAQGEQSGRAALAQGGE